TADRWRCSETGIKRQSYPRRSRGCEDEAAADAPSKLLAALGLPKRKALPCVEIEAALVRSGDEILDKRLGLDARSFGSFVFPMICTFALVAIVASGNGRTGRISMGTRSWAETGCARWWARMGGLAGSTISSASARAMPATASIRVSRWCGARAWQDAGDEFVFARPVRFVSLQKSYPWLEASGACSMKFFLM